MPKLIQKFDIYLISHQKTCPNTLTIMPKWRNFAKSGHTGTIHNIAEAVCDVSLSNSC